MANSRRESFWEENKDPSLSEGENEEIPKNGQQLEYSEIIIRAQDILSSKEYKRRTVTMVRNLLTYWNPFSYFRSSQAEQERWEIPFEDIRDLTFIGSGGQGTVFSGIYRGKEVAVKKVNDPKQTDIKHLRKLEHPNIIAFIGVCTMPPCYCIVMDYCRGGNLYKYLRSQVDIQPHQVIQWSQDISNGMSYLHSKRIIHRDLKSLNILVSDDLSLKISDFGTSRYIENHTTHMTVIGSPSWMAPELIRNESCNEKVDVWSFGVCLWELLTRQEPYQDMNRAAILFGVGSNNLQLPIPTGCPDDIRILMESCWHQKPKMRPSFRQILDQLNLISVGEFVDYTYEMYKEAQGMWQVETYTHFQQIKTRLSTVHLSLDQSSFIVNQREDELKHAQEVREMYEKKLAIASELCEQLAIRKDILTRKEEELEQLASELKSKEDKINKLLHDKEETSDSSNNDSLTCSSHLSRISIKRKKRSIRKRIRKKESSTVETFPEVQQYQPSEQTDTSNPVMITPKVPLIDDLKGDYSPAVKSFLDSFAELEKPSPSHNLRQHRRVQSYGGVPLTGDTHQSVWKSQSLSSSSDSEEETAKNKIKQHRRKRRSKGGSVSTLQLDTYHKPFNHNAIDSSESDVSAQSAQTDEFQT